VLLLVLAPAAGVATADIDPGEYAAPGAAIPARPQQRLRAEIEAEVETERRREQERMAREREAACERERELAARPLAVRLLEGRCTGCHERAYFEDRGYSRVGWELVILRMQLLNGAQLATGERSAIATYLAQRRPASLQRVLLDVTFALSPVVAVILGVLGWRRWRRARRR
jgi:hypothetical protein